MSFDFMIRCSFSAFISKIDTIAYLPSTFDPLGSLSRTEYDFKTTNKLVKKLSLSHKMQESTRENLFKKGILGSALNDAGHYQGGATSLGGCTPPRTGSSSVGDRCVLPSSSPPRAPPSQIVVGDLLPFQGVWWVLLPPLYDWGSCGRLSRAAGFAK